MWERDLRAENRGRKTVIRKEALNFVYTRKTSKIICLFEDFFPECESTFKGKRLEMVVFQA